MSAPMKTPRIKTDVPIQVGGKKPRLFLVPKKEIGAILSRLEEFEIDEGGAIPWRESVQDLIHKQSEPGVMVRGGRVKEGLSQIALAEKLGIPAPNVSEMEHGKRTIGKAMAKRLAKILNLDYKVFL